MSTTTFDTYRFIKRLRDAGVSEQQAEAEAEALAEALLSTGSNLVTEAKLERELSPIKTDLMLLKWMGGVITAGIIAILAKLLV